MTKITKIKTALRNRWLTCLLLLIGWSVSLNAQNVSTYNFAQIAGTYVPIGSGTSALGAGIDDASGSPQGIGFNFTYHGVVYTQFTAQSNGYITLGGIISQNYTPLSGVPDCISFAGGDGRSGPSGIYYAVSGSAPNRVLTIEQPNYYYSYQTNSDYVNVQIKLFETSNDIQIIYGAGAISGSYSRQLGITGASVADFAVRTTSTDWASTTAAGLNSGVMTVSSTVFPANGQTYVFSPPYTYCAASATTLDEVLTNVTFGSINNSSGWTGYANYFATTNTNLVAGNSYPISGTISPYYTGDNMACWIDYNHNGTFDASEITVFTPGPTSTGTVNVPSTALYGVTTMRVRMRWNSTDNPCGTQTYGEVEDYKVTIAPATGCTGTPSASSTVSNSNPVCTGVNFTLSLGTTYSLSGITYQWQSADDAGFTVNVANLGTASTQITSQTAAKYYRCQITCTNSGLSIFSSVLNEGLTTGALCLTYCTSLPSNTADEEIYQITINGASTPGAYANGNGCTTAAPGPGSILSRYSNFKTLGNLTSVQQLQTVSFEVRENECDAGSLYANGVGIWVDFNQNGSFTDAGEAVFIEATTSAATGASPGGDKVVTGTFQIPVTALTGQTVMRITAAEGYSGAILTPCLAYGYGETEDWIINITSAPACSGTPTPGNTLSTVATACSGANFTLSLQNFTTGTGVTYQWQSSPDNSTWTDIGGPTPNATLTVSQTAATYYRSIVTCSGGGSGASNGILVGMSPFYNCYCTTNLGGICGTQSINSVVVAGTTLNNVTNGCSTPYNSFPASGSTTANFVPNQSYNFTVGTGNNGNPAQIAVWIDFNQSGTYDVSEYTLISSSSASGGTSTLAVSIPLTALPGQTGMRIRSDWASSAAFNGSIACNNLPYGETEDYTVTIISLPATPSTPIEVGIPNCATGGNLDPNGTAPVGETWYWQSTASGTSTANPASGLFNILANGTYYLRAQNNTFLTWSTNSSSVTVTDFPAGPADPSVSSPANPACGTVSLVSSVALAGTTNYWQGTNPTGTSTASIADNGTTNNPYSASADGVYYVRAQDNTSFCWSNPVAITVTVWAPPTQPIVNASPLTVCPNSPVLLSAVAPSAPITGYSVTSLNYATMPSPETTTLANAGPTGDEGTVVANLGFSFNYFGTIYSQVQIHTNGYLVFGSSNYVFGGYSPTGPIPTTANTNNWFGHWADMNASAGQISYETQGVAPNRKFIVNYNHDNYYSATPYYSGQLVINELDGSMDIYITHMQTTYTSAVGLENIDGTIGTAAPGHNNVAVAADNEAWHFAPIQAIGFLWSANTAGNGGIASGDEVLANTTGNPPSTTTYTVTLTEPVHGCQSSNSVVVTVSPVPPAPSTTPGATACGSGTVILGATGTGGTLQWFDVATGGTVLGTGTSFTTPSINANTTFYVEENNGTCSGPRAAVLATYTTAPSTTVNSDVTFVCNDGTNTGPGGINNNTVNLSASSGYAYTSYVWTSNPAGFNASGQNVSATPSVNTVYTVTASDGVCTYVNTISVNAGQVPNITSVSGTPPTICQGNTSQLVAAVAGSSGGSVPSGYCSPIMFASNPCNYLNSVATTGGVTNFSNTTASYNGTGYTFFPAYTVSQTLGSSFTLTCQTQGTCGIAYYNVWADWNRDGDFGDVGENVVVANGINSANNFTNFTITVPVTATPGATRMRVLANGNSINPTSACDDFSPFYSEIEDYVIDILGGAGYNFSWTGAGLSATNIFNPVATLGAASTTYNVTVSDAFGCSSTGSVTISEPTAAPGNTLSTTPSACIGVSFTLSTQNNPPGASYQWQSSPDGTTWTDIGSATNPTYTTTQSVATYYRCNVGCPSGSNFTTPIQITQNSFYNCYCTAGATTVGCTSGDEYIGNFTFNTINNSSGCPPSGQYSNFTSISTTIFQNQTYTASVLIPNWFSGDQAAIWIDFDHNGVFDDITEKFSLTSGGGNGTTPYTGSVLIPSNALGGVTGLRVRGAYTGTVSSCGVVTYGEVEDYLVTIGDENCVLAPIYPANAAQICPDNDLALSWPANAGAIGYDVYFDANNPNPTTLVSASQLGTSYSTGVLNTTDTYYWKVVPLYASATCTTPQVFSFTFKPGPTPDATSSAPVCEGQSLSLFGNNTDPLQTTGNSYSWSGPNGFNDVVQNPTINGTTPAAAGTYTVTVTN